MIVMTRSYVSLRLFLLMAPAALAAQQHVKSRGHGDSSHREHGHGALKEGESAIRVLILGHNYAKNLAKELQQLARQSNKTLHVEQRIGSDWSLKQHVEHEATVGLISNGGWNYVAFEEHPETGSFSAVQRNEEARPFAMKLTALIVKAGATPLLLEAWAFREGDQHNLKSDSFAAMQGRLTQGCDELASQTKAKIVPIGQAFKKAFELDSRIELWQHDGRHASRAGIYLASAVLYSSLFDAHPQDLPLVAPNARQGGLRPREVDVLQHVAAEITLGEGKGKRLPGGRNGARGELRRL
jgi:hypothetical protein